MENINPIKFGVTGNQYLKHEQKEDLTKNTAKEQNEGEKKQKQLESKEVLGYMAALNADKIPVKTKRSVDVSKYVNSEQAARIESFMKSFENDYQKAEKIAKDEFAGISDKTAGDLALSFLNSAYQI